MGRVTATIAVTNEVDKILADRGFIPTEQIRSLTLDNVLVDTGATRLCLPEEIIAQLGLNLVGEIDQKARHKPLALNMGTSRQRFQPPSFLSSNESYS
ncbi:MULTISPECIES: hypothetical protein [unclassified Microcoleus]|uniref:hypothetical protein n=1 Tax=unclassified Microcoleus TaxID=2642155 RepID=UPI002FD107A3